MEKYRLRNFFIHFLVSGAPLVDHEVIPPSPQSLDRSFAKKSEKACKQSVCEPFLFLAGFRPNAQKSA
jgi:hypothetical protein